MQPLPYQDLPISQLSQVTGVRRIDVREPSEFKGPLGHLPGSELVPLATLSQAARDWPREAPLLLICRSGQRSANAARWLAAQGFSRLYNLAGGVLAYQEAQTAPAARR
ncbi:MAG: rhodanese-like domain-containing protein [Myxococcota bacterium]|nr:rhodanese-like domain-containing protein [Myxococcota bacterium]